MNLVLTFIKQILICKLPRKIFVVKSTHVINFLGNDFPAINQAEPEVI